MVKPLRIIICLVALVSVGVLVWQFRGSDLVVSEAVSGQFSDDQRFLLLKKISKHIVLPVGDYQIAIVTEPNKLKALSPFYNQVKVNDIVVVYENFALIYDEKADLLVNATMLNRP